MRRINPPRYELMLKGSAPANYTLNSTTLYRTLVKPDTITHPTQIEAFYKYDYGTFKIDWAFRSFEDPNDPRQYNTILFTDHGIYREEITRSIMDHEYWMRWTVFVNKMIERKPKLFITTESYESKKVVWFYPQEVLSEDEETVEILDTNGIVHVLRNNSQLQKSLRYGVDYIDVDESNYIPVHNFRMWYMVF